MKIHLHIERLVIDGVAIDQPPLTHRQREHTMQYAQIFVHRRRCA